MKIVITENKLDSIIEKNGILKTIKVLGGYKNFDSLYPDYFYSGELNRERVINFLNECVEVNNKRQDESSIYLHDYWDDILYREWTDEGDEDNRYFSYESRIMSISTDVANLEVWQYDEDGYMFDDAFEYYGIPLKKLETITLNNIFQQLWGSFEL